MSWLWEKFFVIMTKQMQELINILYQIIEIKKIDTVKKYCKNDYEEHIKTISDHVPIQMDFDIKGG